MLTVHALFEGRVSSGQRKSFQTLTTAKIETTPRIGRDIGSTTDHSARNGPAPSIDAAASSSCGTESKKRLSRKMLKALATVGSQITQGEFSMLQCRKGTLFAVRKAGSASTVVGIMRVASIAPSTRLPSTGRSLEKAYAAATSKTSWNSSAPSAYTVVFSSSRPRSASPQAA